MWPSAALKKLSAKDVQVTEEDIAKGFDANYGERVRCRAIVLGNQRRAQEVWNKARQNPSPEYFGDLAAEYDRLSAAGVAFKSPPSEGDAAMPRMATFDDQCGNWIMLYEEKAGG